MKIRYEVTASCLSPEITARYIQWMKEEHADDLLKLHGCEECRVLLADETHVQCEYIFESEKHLNDYFTEGATVMRQKVRRIFSESDVSFTRSQSQFVFEKKR